MTRISNTLLPTNASGVPQTELTNASVAITASGTLNVSDSVAQGSLSTIASNTSSLSGTLNVSDSTAQSSLSSISSSVAGTLTVSDSSAQSSLSSIVSNTSSLSGTLNVSDSTAQSSLSSIASSVAGTLQVSASATINGSAGNLYNAVSASDGTQSSVVVLSSYTKNTIYLSQTTSNYVKVLVRGVNSGSYIYHSSIYPQDPDSGSNYSGILSLNDVAIYDLKLEATGTDTITASVLSRA